MNKDILKKVKELAERGSEGEKNNAKKILEKYKEMCEEIDCEEYEHIFIDYKSKMEEEFIFQFYGYFYSFNKDNLNEMKYKKNSACIRINKNDKEIFCYTLDIYLRDLKKQKLKVYKTINEKINVLKKQKEYFYYSFLDANNLLKGNDNKNTEDKIDEKVQEAIYRNSYFVDKTDIKLPIKNDLLTISKES